MRIWLACLALAPALSWGQDLTREECLSQEGREVMLDVAMTVIDLKDDEIPERDVVQQGLSIENRLMRAIFLTAANKAYSGYASISGTASAMQIACYEAASQ